MPQVTSTKDLFLSIIFFCALLYWLDPPQSGFRASQASSLYNHLSGEESLMIIPLKGRSRYLSPRCPNMSLHLVVFNCIMCLFWKEDGNQGAWGGLSQFHPILELELKLIPPKPQYQWWGEGRSPWNNTWGLLPGEEMSTAVTLSCCPPTQEFPLHHPK